MEILMVEPFYTGSHKLWMDGYKSKSQHDIYFLTLPGRHWKWRMHGAAVTLAAEYKKLALKPELIICSDFLDLAVFKALLSDEIIDIPLVIYFHENQITYPWSSDDQDVKLHRDRHYGFINYTSALVADRVLFNSYYHQDQFVSSLTDFLYPYPDYKNIETIELIKSKTDSLHLGLDLLSLGLSEIDKPLKPKYPVILWNHRWEYDKNPDLFFNTLFKLKDNGIRFHLIVLGEQAHADLNIFAQAKEKLAEEIIHWGYCDNRVEYKRWLWMADILPVTSNQDFFGISVIEAVYCDTIPLLPDRLAYPEHFKEDHERRQFFYKDNRDLLIKLQRYCMDVKILRKQKTQHIVDHYDWSFMADKYDLLFEGIKMK